jgi:DNA-binding transcriptional MerR regulator
MTPPGDELTIDQLAQLTRMSARNIRAHQSRGLVAPPKLRGRTGYYNRDHVARIELIQELQNDGYSLELIDRMLRTAGGSTAEVLRFTRALHEPLGDERPGVIELAELQRRFRSTDPTTLARAQEIGLVREIGGDRYEEVTPQALRGGEALAEIGVPVEHMLEVAAEVRKHTDAIATAYLGLFLDNIWRPLEEAGAPEDGLARLRDTVERLRPLTSAAVMSVFQVSMREAAERRMELERHRLEQSHAAAPAPAGAPAPARAPGPAPARAPAPSLAPA